jgi:hypothetical protein
MGFYQAKGRLVFKVWGSGNLAAMATVRVAWISNSRAWIIS